MKNIILLILLITPSILLAETSKINTTESKLTWIGSKIVGEKHGGIIKFKSGEIQLEDNKITGGEFVLDMNSIENTDMENLKYKAKIEDHLKSDDFFNTKEYPEGKFVIKGSKIISESETEQQAELVGTLTIKGQGHLISFPATIKKNADGKLTGTATTKIDRTRWDIRYNSKNFFDPAELGDKLILNDIEIGLEMVTL